MAKHDSNPFAQRGVMRNAFSLLVALGACHQGRPGSNAQPDVVAAESSRPTTHAARPLVGRSLGDATAPAVRIVALDPLAESATVTLAKPGNVIVLEVMPGHDIEIIYPTTAKPPKQKGAGPFTVDLGRFAQVPRYSNAERDARARQATSNCEAARAAEARRVAAAARAVRRDSTGKVIGGQSPEVVETRDLGAPCDHLTPNARGPEALREEYATARLPRREPRERYLVVLAARTPVSLVELNLRLTGFTAVATDVATTIEAIATGIFAGREHTWSGYYVSW